MSSFSSCFNALPIEEFSVIFGSFCKILLISKVEVKDMGKFNEKFKEKFKVKVNFLEMAAIEIYIRVIVKVNCKSCEAFKLRIMKYAHSRVGLTL